MKNYTKFIFGFVLFIFFITAIKSYSQPYALGHKQITFTDPARSNRSIPCEIYYPATTAGENTPFATGQFPLIVFGHGFVMADPVLYQYLWQEFAQLGYIIAFPTTESTMFFPSHLNFSIDLKFLNTQIKSENSLSTSFFYGKVAPKTMIMGHSMGGKCGYMASANNTDITAIVSLGAAMGDAPLSTANYALRDFAPYVVVPTLVVDAEFDCVVPIAEGHKLIYDTLTTSCKTYVNIKGGGHCYFASSDVSNCEVGEGSCETFTITRAQQNQIVLDFVVPYVKFMLKNDAASETLFINRLTTGTDITYERSCSSLGSNLQFIKESKFNFYPNPVENFVEFEIENFEFPIQLALTDITGRLIISEKITTSKVNINLTDIESGSYFITLNSKLNKITKIIIKK